MKYRKKPVVIDAVQWFKMGDHPAVTAPYGVPVIDTLEGVHEVTPGDFIITGVKGECYPCKPDIFEMTYESAEVPTKPKVCRCKLPTVDWTRSNTAQSVCRCCGRKIEVDNG